MINSGKARINYEQQMRNRTKRLTDERAYEHDPAADPRHVAHMNTKSN
jgi:hypothetical protein